MEEPRYWMWVKKREFLMRGSHLHASSNVNAISGGSWEEKAFAEDASGPLGGSIWPPRSYSCSFCKREFRSAQALGGHMNVHRRDRARLKESLNDAYQPQNHSLSPLKSLESEICSLDSNLDNHHHHHHHHHHPNYSGPSSIVSSTLSSSRVSVLSTQENSSDLISNYVSPNSSLLATQKQQKGSIYQTGSDSLAVKVFNISCSKPLVEKNLRKEDSYGGFVDTDLFVGSKSVTSQNPPAGCGSVDQAIINCGKRPKTDVSALSLLVNPCSNDRFGKRSQALGLNSSSMEDIDLELRLGEPAKV